MTRSLKVMIAPGPQRTRVMATEGKVMVLKAHLAPCTLHPRALPLLLEALAQWEGETVHAVLAVDEWDASSASALYHGAFTDRGSLPGYTLEWIPVARARRGRSFARRSDGAPLGDFADLRRLLERVSR